MQSWARVVENYSNVVGEVLRSPSQLPATAWFVIQYSKKEPRLNHTIRIDDVLDKSTALKSSDFIPLGGSNALTSGDVYAKTEGVGSRLDVELNEDRLKGVHEGRYVGVIFRQEIGSGTPLAIVILHVSK